MNLRHQSEDSFPFFEVEDDSISFQYFHDFPFADFCDLIRRPAITRPHVGRESKAHQVTFAKFCCHTRRGAQNRHVNGAQTRKPPTRALLLRHKETRSLRVGRFARHNEHSVPGSSSPTESSCPPNFRFVVFLLFFLEGLFSISGSSRRNAISARDHDGGWPVRRRKGIRRSSVLGSRTQRRGSTAARLTVRPKQLAIPMAARSTTSIAIVDPASE